MRTIRYTFAVVFAVCVGVLTAQQWDQVNGSMQVQSRTTTPLVIINQQGTGDALSVRDNGTAVFRVADGGQALTGDGTAAAPAYSFASDPNTGMYVGGANVVAFAADGTRVLYMDSSGVRADLLQFGIGTNDISLSRGAANRLDLATGDSLYLVSGGLGVGATPPASGIDSLGSITTSGNFGVGANGAYLLASLFAIRTAPTVTSAGTSPTIASNGSAAFRVNVGTGGTATTIVLAMPAATTGWNCFAENITATAANRADQRVVMQSSTTTSLTVQNQTISTGVALAFTASDIVSFVCLAY